jgi:hypothetical protein
MENSTYNGWTNYETWNYKLWMDQDGGDYWQSISRDILKEVADSDTFSRKESAQFSLADQLKAECEEQLEEWMPDQASPFADIMNAGISQINWYEIAQSILDDIEEAA